MSILKPLAKAIAAVALLFLVAAPAHADLLSIDWDPDGISDGLSTGQMGAATISFSSTNGPLNGGQTFSGWDWSTIAGSNDVAGIGDAGVNTEGAALDWSAGTAGFGNFDFGGATITNPIVSFTFLDNTVQTFDFNDALTLNILDESSAGFVTIGAGNVVTTNGTGADGINDGFSIEIVGTFGALGFDTNVNSLSSQSVGFSLFADSANIVAAVPEPASAIVILCGFVGLAMRRRR